ncbi:DUF6891 domain-containing protein [Sphingobacterium sp. BIGb0165]|uniref:DUF6891 domain-containing protein n=1 Tax=Sphingobacterium sp. BIGb0165 TaxID=2940615 RepID=UPI0021674E57|nr:hypothetical protein [Sphingobacterium sp. BIGb0165]MCS4224567.1 hypothetical protein [Sphingobacterium sp. BIGb0165]
MGLFNFFKKNTQKSDNEKFITFAEPENEQLKKDVLEFIEQEVKFGFDHKRDILEAVWTAGFEDEDQLDEAWLKHIITLLYNAHQEESIEWKKPNDVDRLAKIFDELNQDKIIALHKAGYTKQDGYSDVREVVHLLKTQNIAPLGYCFYHMQDLERAISPSSKNLFLAFDDIHQNTENAILIGQKIVKKLQENGFAVEWNGTIEQRIEIKNINWQKVPDNQSWGITRAMEYLQKNS